MVTGGNIQYLQRSEIVNLCANIVPGRTNNVFEVFVKYFPISSVFRQKYFKTAGAIWKYFRQGLKNFR